MIGVYALLLVGHVTTQAAPPYNRSYRLLLFGRDWGVGEVPLRYTILQVT